MRIDNIVVLVSGGGTNLQAIIDACADGHVYAQVVGVISSKKGAFALTRAKEAGIQTAVIQKKDYKDDNERDKAIAAQVKSFEGQAIVLAGYMSILGSEIVGKYPIINVHPALIPSFCGKGYYGSKVHQAVLDYGAKLTGATVHFVDEGTDTGPIIMQKCVPVLDGDTAQSLAARVLAVEHEILVKSVALLCDGRLEQDGRRVRIKYED